MANTRDVEERKGFEVEGGRRDRPSSQAGNYLDGHSAPTLAARGKGHRERGSRVACLRARF